MNPLLLLSAVELADRVRRREVSSVEVVKAHIARIKKVNPHINAVIGERFEYALRDALAADKRVASGETDLPPFLGVPFTTKEHYQVAGFPQTAGLQSRRNKISMQDAVLVTRMKHAGFVLLGITNVPEALTWFESYNKVYGRTTNAYSVHHTAGGSSGGEGAIIGAGGSPIGLGGDIGGSIRNPAFFNGVVGLKPTGGTVPETGCWPGSHGKIGYYRQSGPLARRIEDVRAIMPFLSQPDGIDHTVTVPWKEPGEFDPASLTVHWFGKVMMAPTPDVKRGLDRGVSALKDAGFATEQWRPPEVHRAFELWATALSDAGGAKFVDTLGDFRPVDLASNWAKWPLRRSEFIFPCLALATLEKAVGRYRSYAGHGGTQSEDLRVRLRDTIEQRLGDSGVLVFPTFHTTAPRHGLDCVRHTLGFVNCGFLNPMELPAVTVPTGFGEDTGLPTGIQIAGPRGSDQLLLFVAEIIEKRLGGWQPGPIQGTAIS